MPEASIGVERAAWLYGRHCAACHGMRGDADTPTASLLFPAPRPFRSGLFKLASTQNGVPTDEDLVRTLRRGMPGSAMPGHGWLADDDLLLLARYVREIAIEALAEHLRETAASARVPIGGAEALALARKRLEPGAPVVVPAAVPDTPENRELGREIYLVHCAACHGADGKGRRPAVDWAGIAELNWPRDFTAGFLRGAATATELACRIRAGMPGAQMPPTALTDAETALLLRHLQSMIPDGAGEHHVQWRRHLRARRLESMPDGPADPAWARLEAVRLPTAPLWWRQDAVFEVELRVAHDGDRIAFQLSWPDGSRNDANATAAMRADAAALQFTAAVDPPFFGMGQDEKVEIWHWQAMRPEDMAGSLDLLEGAIATARHSDAVPGLPSGGAPSHRAESVRVAGPRALAAQRGSGRSLAAAPQWRAGRWQLVLERSMRAEDPGGIGFVPGQRVLLAVALWDGNVDPGPASKSVTTWHSLAID